MKKTLSSLVLAFIAFVSLADRASASIVVIAPTATLAGSFQITADITFNITTRAPAAIFVLDELVTSDDGNRTFTPSNSFSFLISINGNLPVSYDGRFVDNAVTGQNQITPNDGYFFSQDDFLVEVGDTVTVKAGTFILPAVADFNQQTSQTFSGDMFIARGNGVQLSNTVNLGAVPEPSSFLVWGVLGLAGVGLTNRRRS